ncbi:MAG: ATP-binding protein [Acidimicrobiales bacterium]
MTSGSGYALATDDIDAGHFESAVQAARTADPNDQVELYDSALRVWTGSVLDEFAHEAWAIGTAVRFSELHSTAQTESIAARLAAGDSSTIADVEALVLSNPLRDRPRMLLMRALADAGRRTEALRAFQDYRDLLLEEVGIEPSRELFDLDAEIAVDSPSPEPVPLPARPAPTNLPTMHSSFIGRDGELQAVSGQIVTNKLTTITGPGGVGKTRLALASASEVRDRFDDGVWFAGLSSLRSVDLVARHITTALGLNPGTGTEDPLDQLLDFFQSRQSLLLVDNCEHVVDGAASVIDSLVTRCANLSILASSREPLRVDGELLYSLGPLPGPEAARLFVDRAVSANPAFVVDAESQESINSIIRRLDGLPLAVELAASQTPSMTPGEIETRLDDALDLLSGGKRTAPHHQQTLRSTIGWSYELLGEHERDLFAMLAVFPGDFGLDAAEALSTSTGIDRKAVVPAIAQLVDKSLLVSRTHRGSTRYRYLDTIKTFATERLAKGGHAEQTRRAHARWVVSVAERFAAMFDTPAQLEALALLDAENSSLDAAIQWLIDGGHEELASRIATALGPAWWCGPVARPALIELARVDGIEQTEGWDSILGALLYAGDEPDPTVFPPEDIVATWRRARERSTSPPNSLALACSTVARLGYDGLTGESWISEAEQLAIDEVIIDETSVDANILAIITGVIFAFELRPSGELAEVLDRASEIGGDSPRPLDRALVSCLQGGISFGQDNDRARVAYSDALERMAALQNSIITSLLLVLLSSMARSHAEAVRLLRSLLLTPSIASLARGNRRVREYSFLSLSMLLATVDEHHAAARCMGASDVARGPRGMARFDYSGHVAALEANLGAEQVADLRAGGGSVPPSTLVAELTPIIDQLITNPA